jgi:hypothetical protein
MRKYAYRIRKIQIQMGIKPTDFDPDILDENTVTLIDMKYRSQAPQNPELKNAEESRIENTELNYEEIMTGSNYTHKMPDPRENIFATYYSRDKSCPSPAERRLLKVDKKASYYNHACYVGPLTSAEPSRVQIDRHVINYKTQCYEGPKHDQRNTADETSSTSISLEKARRLLDDARVFSREILQDKAGEHIPPSGDVFPATGPALNSAIHKDKYCDYPATDQEQSQNYSTYPDQIQVDTHVTHFDRQSHSDSVKHDQNNFAAPDPSQPPVYPILEGKARAPPAEDSMHAGDSIYPKPVIHTEKACPNLSESQLQSSKKQKTIQRKRSCHYKTADSS